MDFDEYMDSIQDDFDSIEEKRKSSTMPDLERAPGKADNWVEKAGGLPKYIERIAKHLHYEQGMSIGHAIAAAVNTVKRWAKGGGDVKPDTVAKAQAALAEWEAKKGKSGKKDFMGTDADTLVDMGATETPLIEYKNVGVRGLRVADPQTGIVEAIVSVTGIKDEVNDVIKPGAYAKTLAKRLPKGVYSHAWDQPISKTLDIKELMPGDPRLPKKMANGTPWPREAGALWVKMQFNLDTERGRTAFSDVKFFGDEQEWSIGYNVPVGGAKVNPKAGIREIDYLDLFEYSPVLFGAMPLAATQSVKSAQTAYKAMRSQGMWSEPDWMHDEDDTEEKSIPDGSPIEVEANMPDSITAHGDEEKPVVVEVFDDGTIEEANVDEYEEVTVEELDIKALLGPDDVDLMVKTLNALNELLGTATGFKVHSQVPGDEVDEKAKAKANDNPSSVEKAAQSWFEDDSEMVEAAAALDEALGSSDEEAIDIAANDLLDLVEDRMDGDDADGEALTRMAKLVARMIENSGPKKPPSESAEEKKIAPPAKWDDSDFEEDDEPVEEKSLVTVQLPDIDSLRRLLE